MKYLILMKHIENLIYKLKESINVLQIEKTFKL